MKHTLIWINCILIMVAFVTVTDLIIDWYKHPSNNFPVLKYSAIGLSSILFLTITLFILNKRKK